MELRHVRYFLAVADTLNFTRAAERLHTSQPSLSQQIRALEREIGRALFTRTSRSVQLTPAGELFAAGARRMMEELRTAVADAKAAPGGPDREVRVGFLIAAEILLLPKLLPAIRAMEPELEISLTAMTSRQQLEELEQDRIDIGFMRPPIDNPRLRAEPVMTENVQVIIGAEHPFAGHEAVQASALEQVPVVGVSDNVPGLQHAVRLWAQRRSLRLNIVQHADNVVEYMSLVRLGIGVGLLPTFSDHIMLSGLTARPIADDPPTIELVMAHRTDASEPTMRFLSAAQRAIADPTVVGQNDQDVTRLDWMTTKTFLITHYRQPIFADTNREHVADFREFDRWHATRFSSRKG